MRAEVIRSQQMSDRQQPPENNEGLPFRGEAWGPGPRPVERSWSPGDDATNEKDGFGPGECLGRIRIGNDHLVG